MFEVVFQILIMKIRFKSKMVITFLPYPDFYKSLECLDSERLNKQCLECAQIIRALEKSGKVAWANHPASRMWVGYENALKLYHNQALYVRQQRFPDRSYSTEALEIEGIIEMPPWFGIMAVHYSHRASLIAKAPTYYSCNPEVPLKHYFEVPPIYLESGYVWPLNTLEKTTGVKKVYYKELLEIDSENPPKTIFAEVNLDTRGSAHLSEFRSLRLLELRDRCDKKYKKLNKKQLYLILYKSLTLEQANKAIDNGYFNKTSKKEPLSLEDLWKKAKERGVQNYLELDREKLI